MLTWCLDRLVSARSAGENDLLVLTWCLDWLVSARSAGEEDAHAHMVSGLAGAGQICR